MKQDDIVLLKEVQRNARMAMTTIDTLLDKSSDDDFTKDLARRSLGYAKLHNDAVEMLMEEGNATYRNSQLSDMALRGSIHMGTLTNISTSRLAEMMIRGSSRGLTNIYKAVKHSAGAQDMAVELAKEFMDFEEKGIGQMREYL